MGRKETVLTLHQDKMIYNEIDRFLGISFFIRRLYYGYLKNLAL